MVVFSRDHFSLAAIDRIPWDRLRLNPLVLVSRGTNTAFTLWDIDHLSKGQFEQLREEIRKANEAVCE